MFELENYFILGHRKPFIAKHDFCFRRTLSKHFCVCFFMFILAQKKDTC